jgi:hypothetical protein
LLERKTGINLAWIPFNRRSEAETSLRAKMNLSADKKLWVLFTSSTDETAGDPDMKGPFDTQLAWVREVVEWVSTRPDVQLIIKVHPNLAGNHYIGKAIDELRIYEEMRANLPSNVRIAMPEDSVDAYLLAEEADVGLTYGSIIGLEMAMLGKPVFLASRALYENCSTILTVRSRESLPEVLEKCLHASTNREIQREAFRLASCYIRRFELDFPVITVLNVYEAKRNFTQPDELGPGKDASLDRICNYLIDGSPLYETPSAQDIERTTDEENAFFDQLATAQPAFEEAAGKESIPLHSRDRVKRLLLRLPFAARIAGRSAKADEKSQAPR